MSTMSNDDVKEVILAETGYLMEIGFDSILESGQDVFVPYFCINELKKISKSDLTAVDLLKTFWKTEKIGAVDIRWQEELKVIPNYSVKNRSWGIVATAIFLIEEMEYKVHLFTNSSEIVALAKLQYCGIDVVKVKKI